MFNHVGDTNTKGKDKATIQDDKEVVSSLQAKIADLELQLEVRMKNVLAT